METLSSRNGRIRTDQAAMRSGRVAGANYIPEIDGLRAIAVFAVMIYHAEPSWLPGGFIGVDVFFVISGFLITRVIYADHARGGFSLARFWDRRARRILPPMLVLLATAMVAGWFLMSPSELASVAADAAAAQLSLANVRFWVASGSYFALAAPLQPLLHLWSLGVEEQYYLFYPIAAALILRRRPRALRPLVWIATAASFVFACYTSVYHPSAGFYLPFSRAWELLAGCALALGLVPRIRRNLVADLACAGALFSLAATFLVVDAETPWPGPWTVPTVVATIVLIACAPSALLVGSLLASRPAVALGLVSYGAYLWHHALLAFFRVVGPNALTSAGAAGLLLASLLAGGLSYKFVEQPCRSDKLLPSKIFWPGLIVAFTAVGSSAGYLRASDGAPDRLPQDVRSIADMSAQYPLKIDRCFYPPGTNKSFEQGCVRGSAHGRRAMVIVGDSHAVALAPGFDPLLRHAGVTAQLLTAAGCPPVTDPRILSTQQTHCAAFNERVFRWISNHPELRVVVLAARWPYALHRTFYDNAEGGVELGVGDDMKVDRRFEELFEAELSRQVSRMLALGKTVVVIYPIPEPGWDVPKFLVHQYLLDGTRQMPSIDRARWHRRESSAAVLLDRLGDHPRLIRVRPANETCGRPSPDRCALGSAVWPYYFDVVHPNVEGALIMVDRAMTRDGSRNTVLSALRGERAEH